MFYKVFITFLNVTKIYSKKKMQFFWTFPIFSLKQGFQNNNKKNKKINVEKVMAA